jgi:hypothetical protein
MSLFSQFRRSRAESPKPPPTLKTPTATEKHGLFDLYPSPGSEPSADLAEIEYGSRALSELDRR